MVKSNEKSPFYPVLVFIQVFILEKSLEKLKNSVKMEKSEKGISDL
jgi:hypothetical protein